MISPTDSADRGVGMTDQAASSTIQTDPPRIGEIRILFGIRLRWNGSQWQKVKTDG